MSTSAESSKKWLEDKNPSNEEVFSIIQKLEARIEAWQGDDEEIQGSIDAALVLQTHLDSLSTSTEEVANTPVSNLDTSNLIPDVAPIQLEQTVKDQTFASLKSQLGITITK